MIIGKIEWFFYQQRNEPAQRFFTAFDPLHLPAVFFHHLLVTYACFFTQNCAQYFMTVHYLLKCSRQGFHIYIPFQPHYPWNVIMCATLQLINEPQTFLVV